MLGRRRSVNPEKSKNPLPELGNIAQGLLASSLLIYGGYLVTDGARLAVQKGEFHWWLLCCALPLLGGTALLGSIWNQARSR